MYRSHSRSRSPEVRERRSYKSRSRSRSASRSRSRSGSRSRGRRHSSRSPGPVRDDRNHGYRVHVGDLDDNHSESDVREAFERFGKVKEVWTAKNAPCFGFVVFDHRQDAEDAVKELHKTKLGHSTIRVTHAKPRRAGMGSWDPGMRCYQCGERGHFSRDCAEFSRMFRRGGGGYYGGGYRGRSRSRSRSRSRERRYRRY